MALHIQMSEEAEAELKKAAQRNKLSSTLAGLLFIVLDGLILYLTVILIAGPSDPEFMTYTPRRCPPHAGTRHAGSHL